MPIYGKTASRGTRKIRVSTRPNGSGISKDEAIRQARQAIKAGTAVDWARTEISLPRGPRLGPDPLQLLRMSGMDDLRKNGGDRRKHLHDALNRILDSAEESHDPRFRDRMHRTLDGIINERNKQFGEDDDFDDLKELLGQYFQREEDIDNGSLWYGDGHLESWPIFQRIGSDDDQEEEEQLHDPDEQPVAPKHGMMPREIGGERDPRISGEHVGTGDRGSYSADGFAGEFQDHDAAWARYCRMAKATPARDYAAIDRDWQDGVYEIRHPNGTRQTVNFI